MSRRYKFFIVLLAGFLIWNALAWVAAESLIVEKPLERADAILVLGGSKVYVERTRKAAELYHQGIAPKVFLTDDGARGGWSHAEQRNPPFVELAKKELLAQGVSAEDIEILQPQVSGTIDEAQVLRRKATEINLKKVLIVTSGYHTRRALRTFQNVLANSEIEIGISSPPPGIQTPRAFSWWLSPFGWNVVAGEYVKSAYYWMYY